LDPIPAASVSPESAAGKPQRPRRRWLVLGVLTLAFATYVVIGALRGTTENSFVSPSDLLLWIALPFGLLGALFITLHVLVRRRRAQ
jgi:uncharacterized membrane protein YhaH (DUF805 family)